jgi:hypothetical protein
VAKGMKIQFNRGENKMGLRQWIGDINNPNNMNPRIVTLLIILLLATIVWISLNSLSVILMLLGILLISLDKIFTKSCLINKSANFSNKSKIKAVRDFWHIILHYGIINNYLGLIGTGIIIAVTIFEIHRAFFGGCTTILAIPWGKITKTVPSDRFVSAVPTIVGAFLAGVIGIFVVLFSKYYEDLRNRKYAYRVLILEVNANQNRLQTHIRNSEEVLKNLEENDAVFEIVDFSVERTVYFAISDKIGLLDLKIRENVVQYYIKIKLVEDEVRACNKEYPSYYGQRRINELSRNSVHFT